MEKIFKVGDKVFDIRYGWGKVVSDDRHKDYPILVEFKQSKASYTLDGRFYDGENKDLSFTEYTLEGFSQERPCECEFKDGDPVWVKNSNDLVWHPMIFKGYKNNKFMTYSIIGSFNYWDKCKPFEKDELKK